jgi:hypothetical protein
MMGDAVLGRDSAALACSGYGLAMLMCKDLEGDGPNPEDGRDIDCIGNGGSQYCIGLTLDSR